MVVRPTPVSRLSICTKVGRINGAAADGLPGPESSMLANGGELARVGHIVHGMRISGLEFGA